MASKQTYECYVCKRSGFADVRVILDGKTEDGKTIYKNPDMSPHLHKQQGKPQPQPQQVQDNSKDNPLAPVSDESVDRGITAFTMIDEVEQVKKEVTRMYEVLGNQERLFNEVLSSIEQIKNHLRQQVHLQ